MKTFNPFFVLLFLCSGWLNAQVITNDLSFGTDGFITQPTTPGFFSFGLELYEDGSILLAEHQWDFYFSMYRFTPDGNPDPDFGGGGQVQYYIGDNDAILQTGVDMEVLEDGTAVFLVDQYSYGYYQWNSDGRVYRFDEDGNNVGDSYLYFDFDADSDDKVSKLEGVGSEYKVTGNIGSGIYFFDYLWIYVSGSPWGFDLTYYFDGSEIGTHTATLPNGDYYIAGSFFGQGGVIRISQNNLDLEFGNDGFALFSGSIVQEVYSTSNGKILARSGNTLYRLNTNGTLDLFFGNNGALELPTQPSDESADGFAYFADGRIMVAGNDGNIYQYLPDGTLNPDFGTNGVYTVMYDGAVLPINDFQLQGDSSFVVYGVQGDNMVVGRFELETSQNDLGVQVILTPNSGDLTDSETVSVSIGNYGQLAQSDFEVAYQIDGGLPVVEMVSQTIAPGEQVDFTFATPADLSIEGNYEITAYTNLANDGSPFNDATVKSVEHFLMFNGEVFNLQPQDACGSGFGLQFTLKNLGTDMITSVDFAIQIDGSQIDTYTWMGNLAPGGEVEVDYTTPEEYPGMYEVVVTAELINSQPDGDPSNNMVQASNFEGELTPGNTLNIEFLSDGIPSEVTWKIEDLNFNVIAEGGPYGSPYTLYVETVCQPIPLVQECYRLKLFDSYGDGFTGYGSIQISDDEGNVLIFVDDFSDNFESYDFCYTPCLFASATAIASGSSFPDAGSITVAVDNPEGTIQYSLDGGLTFQTENVFTGLPAGTYEVLVANDQDCEVILTVDVPECQINGMLEASPSSEAGAADGSLLLTITDPIGSVSYSIDGGVTQQSDPLFEGLVEGTYDVWVIDSLGCAWSQTVDLPACALDLSVETNPTTSAAAMDGSMELFPAGAFGPVSYSIDGGLTFQSDPLFEGLSEGTYDVVVSDSLGCTWTETIEVLTCLLDVTVESTPESAAGAMDGAILITAVDGFEPLMYSIDGGLTFQSSPEFEGLSLGTYTIIVQDAEGCFVEVEHTMDIIISSSNLPTGMQFNCFPNPTRDLLNLQLEGAILPNQAVQFRLMDVTGKVVSAAQLLPQENFGTRLSLEDLPAGVYIWSIKLENTFYYGRVVKQ